MKKVIGIVFLSFLVLMFLSTMVAISESQGQKSEQELMVARHGGFRGGHHVPHRGHHRTGGYYGTAPQCFVATAAYGNPDHPHVWILREFREKWLVGNWAGEGFINSYYKYGPKAAQFMEGREYLKRLAKGGLYPIVGAARYLNALRE